MKSKLNKRRCEECGEKFQPRIRTQIYHTVTCKNRAAQERLRQRAKGSKP